MYPASWHCPSSSPSPDDGDGNINGDVRFRGRADPTCPANFELGRAYVNDARIAYVGFEQGDAYGDNNIFSRTPRQPDQPRRRRQRSPRSRRRRRWFDFYFAPSVGCILGEVRRPSTELRAAGLALNIGQGVFRLEHGLSDVPGALAAVQSLATGGRGREQTNFIELAIPLVALGRLAS